MFKCMAIPLDDVVPGKLVGPSPELANHKKFDAYANDIHALGPLFYMLATGQAMYRTSSFTEMKGHTIQYDDPRYGIFYSGNWLRPDFMNHTNLKHHSKLNPSLLDLINNIIKPEKDRLQLEDIFNHPWIRNDITSIPMKRQRIV